MPEKNFENKIAFRKIKSINTKTIALNLIVLILLIIGVVVVFHDYSWYHTPVVKIESAGSTINGKSSENGSGETYYDQTMTGTIMNGTHHGQTIDLKSQYSSSGVLEDKYAAGDEVFVKIDPGAGGKLSGSVLGLKRDKYMAVFLALFLFFLFVITSKKGFFFVISLAANIAILWYALNLNYHKHSILMLSNGLVLFFTFVSLLFISGWNRKTFVAILSTLISLCITMLLFRLLMAHMGGIDYSYMTYIAGQNNLSELFLSQILIGGLGATMDVAITEVAAINELVEKNSGISVAELLKSGREVGYDIMGTMINIMLFAYICGIIPLIILKVKNDIALHTVILWQIPMELYRFLIGSIGILLTVPISILVSIILFKKLRRVA